MWFVSKLTYHTDYKEECRYRFFKIFSYFESAIKGSQFIHPSSGTNDTKESSSEFEDSDEQEEKEDNVGLRKNNSQNLGHFFTYLRLLLIYLFTFPVYT